jgi:hypothetical protein
MAVSYCRRLIFDTALRRGCIFDTPHALSGDYLDRYAHVQELVITERACRLTKELPRAHWAGKSERHQALFHNIATFHMKRKAIDDNVGRISVYVGHDEMYDGDFISKILQSNKDVCRPAGFRQYFDFHGVGCLYKDEDLWYGVMAGIRFVPGRFLTTLEMRAELIWTSLRRIYKADMVNNLESDDGIAHVAPDFLVVYDLPELLINKEKIPSDPDAANEMARELLHATVIRWDDTYVPGKFEAIMARVKLENSGEKQEQYPMVDPRSSKSLG